MNLHASQPGVLNPTSEWPHDGVSQVAALLSVQDVCLTLQCGRTFVYELFHKRELRRIKLGRLTRVSPEDLAAFVGRQTAAGTAGAATPHPRH